MGGELEYHPGTKLHLLVFLNATPKLVSCTLITVLNRGMERFIRKRTRDKPRLKISGPFIRTKINDHIVLKGIRVETGRESKSPL